MNDSELFHAYVQMLFSTECIGFAKYNTKFLNSQIFQRLQHIKLCNWDGQERFNLPGATLLMLSFNISSVSTCKLKAK